MRRAYASAAAAAAFCAAGSTYAEPGGATDTPGPTIKPHVLEFGGRTAYFDGGALNETWAHSANIMYGLTDWLKPIAVVRAAQATGEQPKITSVAVALVVDLASTREWPLHLGVSASYRAGIADGVGEGMNLKLLAERRTEDYTLRANLSADREFGDGRWTTGYAARFSLSVADGMSIGVEGFGEFEEDAHYWGPRLGLKFGETNMSISYVAGLADARADAQLRFAVEFAV